MRGTPRIHGFAKRTGIDVIGNYIARAFSAKSDHCPEFQRMIKHTNRTYIGEYNHLGIFIEDVVTTINQKKLLKKF